MEIKGRRPATLPLDAKAMQKPRVDAPSMPSLDAKAMVKPKVDAPSMPFDAQASSWGPRASEHLGSVPMPSKATVNTRADVPSMPFDARADALRGLPSTRTPLQILGLAALDAAHRRKIYGKAKGRCHLDALRCKGRRP